MGQPRKWTEDDGEDVLWICLHCGAELHADCVGNECPVCDAPIEDEADGVG